MIVSNHQYREGQINRSKTCGRCFGVGIKAGGRGGVPDSDAEADTGTFEEVG